MYFFGLCLYQILTFNLIIMNDFVAYFVDNNLVETELAQCRYNLKRWGNGIDENTPWKQGKDLSIKQSLYTIQALKRIKK